MFRRAALCFMLALPMAAQLPDVYRSVDRVVWVVDDFKSYAAGWAKLGLIRVDSEADLDLPLTVRGQAVQARVHKATGFLGDVYVEWIEPRGGHNPFADYQARHKAGVFSLVHHVATKEALEQETARLRALGVGVLAAGADETWFDTEADGKYVLGLVAGKSPEPPAVPPEKHVVQFAFTVHDLKPVSAYWARLGLGAMAFNKGNLSDVEYWGKPIQIDQAFGWQRGRKVVYEWLQPVTSPNVFDDHMKTYGEGVHHIAFNVPDMPRAVADWTATGLRVASSGAWGAKDKPGSGRFTYVATEPIGGVIAELLWNFR